MADQRNNLYILSQAIEIFKKKYIEDLTPEDQAILKPALKLYLSYCKAATNEEYDIRIEQGGLPIFFLSKPYNEIQAIYSLLSRPQQSKEKEDEEEKPKEEKKEKEEEIGETEKEKKKEEEKVEKQVSPTKEVSTVPADLEQLVQNLKDKQANEIIGENQTKNYSIEKSVIRAQKFWANKRKYENNQENRLAQIQDQGEREKQREIEEINRDLFLVDKVNPKAESAQLITRNIESAARQAVVAQASNLGVGLTSAQINQAVKDLTYLGLSGGVDYTNFNDLNVVTQLAFRNQGITFTSPINDVDVAVQAWQKALEIEPYSDTPEELEKQITEASKDAERYVDTSTKIFSFKLKQNNSDIDVSLENAKNEQEKVQTALQIAIPNPKALSHELSPLEKDYDKLEAALRSTDNTLRINPEGTSVRAAETLKTVDGSNRQLSPEAITLLGLGLTTQKLEAAEAAAKKDPNSPIGQLYRNNRDIFEQVRFQLKNLESSKLGKEISSKTKPLTGISKSLTENFNKGFGKLSPAAQNAAKLVRDPAGTINNYFSRKFAERLGNKLIQNTGSVLSQKLGGFLLKEGFQGGVKALISEATSKLVLKAATWAATKLGISLAAESLNGIAPGVGLLVDIAIQAALLIGEKTIGAIYSSFQSLAKSIYGEEIQGKDIAALGGIVVGGAVATGVAFMTGIRVAIVATQIALVSAFFTIMLTLAVIALYLGAVFSVAPMLSSFVQLDSVEKVIYPPPTGSSSSDCAWPTKGHFMVQEGPDAGTHHLSHLQAIDIFGPGNINGTDTVSSTNGTVVSAGQYSNYGNTIIIQTTNAAGSFQVIYGHMGSMAVSPGQKVSQGQKIGTVGSTVLFPNPHIHFEYKGIEYNKCPAGGKTIPVGCLNFLECGSVYTN